MSEVDILKTYRVVAMVGLSSKEDRPSNKVARYLTRKGFQVIPVNPAETEILGEKSYPDLKGIPQKVEIVDIFRKSEDVGPIVDEAIGLGAKVIWMQEGVKNEQAAKKANQAGLEVVMDKCMKKTHERFTRLHMI